MKHFNNSKIAGVYGPVFPLDNASVWEWLYYTGGLGYQLALDFASKRSAETFTKPRMGLLGSTNCLLRKNLWEKHPFQDAMAGGGEDTEWGIYFMKMGYLIVREPGMAVRHSHGIGFLKLFAQHNKWRRLYRLAVRHPNVDSS